MNSDVALTLIQMLRNGDVYYELYEYIKQTHPELLIQDYHELTYYKQVS